MHGIHTYKSTTGSISKIFNVPRLKMLRTLAQFLYNYVAIKDIAHCLHQCSELCSAAFTSRDPCSDLCSVTCTTQFLTYRRGQLQLEENHSASAT